MELISMGSSNRQSGSNRRKVRKGTRSCWECRGRKVKCTLLPDSLNNAVCEGCLLRGTKCVSQDLPEHPVSKVDRRVQMRHRMVQVEQLLGSLVKGNRELSLTNRPPEVHDDIESSGNTSVLSNPSQLSSNNSVRITPLPAFSVDGIIRRISASSVGDDLEPAPIHPRYQKMSEKLLSVYPVQDIVLEVVRLAGLVPPFFHQMAPKSSTEPFHLGEQEKQSLMGELVIRHTPLTHPLIILRQMLLLAIAFRYIHPASQASLTVIDEQPGNVMQRIGDAALRLVEENDNMMETPEGIECLLLASTLHADSGNLRSAWTTSRRAMLLAQLMASNRQTKLPVKALQPGNSWDPRSLWYRIVFFDRFFSLALGLPQGSTDNSMASSLPYLGNKSPLWDLQRRHCALAGRILQRNELEPSLRSYDETISIDNELQMAAQSMPPKWWLVPNLASIQDATDLYQATMRLTEQVFHNILLIHLHLPFMLRSILEPDHPPYTEPSRFSCINASRDFLHRYMALRNFSSVSYCCHSMDFFAVTASVILLLGYLDDHLVRGSGKTLTHVRQSDRAVMEDILENMAQTGTLDKQNALSERGAVILGQLLAIETNVWRNPLLAPSLVGAESDPAPEGRALHLIMPCFGIVTITEVGKIISGVGNGSPSVGDSSLDFSVAQTATVQNDIGQVETRNYVPDVVDNTVTLHVPHLAYGSQDNSQQLDWLVQDAHIAFLNSMVEGNGDGTSIIADSWWLL